MMKLFIQIVNGQPINHPIFEDNFKEAFPHIDVDNLPPEYVRFERIECPKNAGLFEVDEVRYEWGGDVVKDVWSVRPMTEVEKNEYLKSRSELAMRHWNTLKQITQRNIDSTTGDLQNVWVNYLNQLNAWVLVDPVNPNFPKIPVISNDGSILTTSNSGSAPNVIS